MEQRLVDINKVKEVTLEDSITFITYIPDNGVDCYINADTVLTLPEHPTNGDMIKALFPEGRVKHEPSITHDKMVFSFPDGTYFGAECRFNTKWWNAPYVKKEDK